VFDSEKGKVRKHSTGEARSEYEVVGEQASLTRLLDGKSKLVITDN
jgi:hypothetical protein